MLRVISKSDLIPGGIMTAALDTTDLSTDDELITAISSAHDAFNREQAEFLVGLGHFDQRGLATMCGSKSTAAWIVRRFDVADSTAYDYIRVARTLIEYELVADSFRSGNLNYSKVRLLARYLTEDNEVDLVMLAESMSYRELVRALAGRGQPDQEDKPQDQSEFEIWVDQDNGDICFKGRLDAVRGQQLIAALKVGELANLVDLSELDEDVLKDSDKLDEALDAAEEQPIEVEAELVGEDKAERTASRFGRTSRGKLMSAFEGLLNVVLSSPANNRRAPGAQVHVMFTEDGHSFLPGNPKASAQSLTGAVLNGHMRGHMLDNKGVPLNMGRKRRLVSDSQALAILAQWMFQCAMPGCNHTQFIEFHHIVSWMSGGLTNADNLLPLCSHCHSLVTKGMVTVDLDPLDPAKLLFKFRDGTEFVSENRSLPLRGATKKPYLDTALPEEPIRRFGDDLSFDDD